MTFGAFAHGLVEVVGRFEAVPPAVYLPRDAMWL